MALIEALVAATILGIGLLGAAQLTLKTLNAASESRQYTVAQQLAQEAMNCLHAQTKANTLLCPSQDSLEVQGVRYTRQTQYTPRGDGQLTDLMVRVQWTASGKRTPASANANSGSPADRHLEWHSSASALPSWLGVSSP
jgi:Tfp pilus assembly protein PilV